jgi:hypothetical protein
MVPPSLGLKCVGTGISSVIYKYAGRQSYDPKGGGENLAGGPKKGLPLSLMLKIPFIPLKIIQVSLDLRRQFVPTKRFVK